MKKIFTLCFFAIAFLFSTQNTTAQNTLEINEAASVKTKELRKTLKFDKEKMDDVYRAYQEFGKAYKKISNSSGDHKERLDKINHLLDEKLRTILTAEQFDRYLEIERGQTE
ncbi:hypothetical protein [Psychroserpens sp. SPM9]|uniref:hypothetical protein n=1 Tax=Psychroserpens sp. SPM9 TaxID=2975598 RepID=UPI0021A6D28D|nr:hypothetical protein [Psychroserpens sp. SPM9]MDG5489948.1 hypothetical protein [Psychroserpens sp. SPM9]